MKNGHVAVKVMHPKRSTWTALWNGEKAKNDPFWGCQGSFGLR